MKKSTITIITAILLLLVGIISLIANLAIKYKNYMDAIEITTVQTATQTTAQSTTQAIEETSETEQQATTEKQTEKSKSDVTVTESTTELEVTELSKNGLVKTTPVDNSTIQLSKINLIKRTEQITKKTKKVDEDELYLMAHLLYGECADGSQVKMQMYIGSVALNRVASKEFPNNLHDVIYQKGQYACTWDGNFNKTPDEQTWENARKLLEEGSVLPANVVYQAEFRQGSGVYAQIGNMYFCYA